MEEELNYASVTFRSNSVSTHEKPNDLEIIYDEVKSEQQGSDTRPVKKDNKKKAPMFTLLHVVAAVLGIICVSLLSVLITLSIYFKAVVSERLRENSNLTAQKLQLWTEKTDLERRNEELTRERDGLNWTIGVILEHKDFPVERHCPQKEKPNDLEVIYDDAMCEEQGSDTRPVKPVVLGITCVSLLLVRIALSIYFEAVVSERPRENSNLTAQNLQLWTEKNDLERRNEELTQLDHRSHPGTQGLPSGTTLPTER